MKATFSKQIILGGKKRCKRLLSSYTWKILHKVHITTTISGSQLTSEISKLGWAILGSASLILLQDVCLLHVLVEDLEPLLKLSLVLIGLVVLLHEDLEHPHVAKVMAAPTNGFLNG